MSAPFGKRIASERRFSRSCLPLANWSELMMTRAANAEIFSTRGTIRDAERAIRGAAQKLDEIRDYYNLEHGENKCCDLDLALRHALRKVEEAQAELQSLLSRPRLGLNFKHGRSWV